MIIFTIKPTAKTVMKMVKKKTWTVERALLCRHITCAETKNWKLLDKNYYFLIPFYKANTFDIAFLFCRHGHISLL